MGDDLACEVLARAMAAAGVGRLLLIRRTGALPSAVTAAIGASNPDVRLDVRGWPQGESWLDAIAGASLVVRSGFDDDPMLRAAVRLGIPVVVMRARAQGIDVISFRRNGPCAHAPLDIPERPSVPFADGPDVVAAAHIAAAEALALLAGAATGEGRARLVSITPGTAGGRPGTERDQRDGGSDSIKANDVTSVRAVDLAWTPECFACGGTGAEMSLS